MEQALLGKGCAALGFGGHAYLRPWHWRGGWHFKLSLVGLSTGWSLIGRRLVCGRASCRLVGLLQLLQLCGLPFCGLSVDAGWSVRWSERLIGLALGGCVAG